MRTIALRFADSFAPPTGTIAEHQKIIKAKGYVWYGKLGAPISGKVRKELLEENDDPQILLIQSGKSARYWAHIDQISMETPALEDVPDYYHDQVGSIKTWFRIKSIVEADKKVMSNCLVASSGASLSTTSRRSMSPYFIIDYLEKGEKQCIE